METIGSGEITECEFRKRFISVTAIEGYKFFRAELCFFSFANCHMYRGGLLRTAGNLKKLGADAC